VDCFVVIRHDNWSPSVKRSEYWSGGASSSWWWQEVYDAEGVDKLPVLQRSIRLRLPATTTSGFR